MVWKIILIIILITIIIVNFDKVNSLYSVGKRRIKNFFSKGMIKNTTQIRNELKGISIKKIINCFIKLFKLDSTFKKIVFIDLLVILILNLFNYNKFINFLLLEIIIVTSYFAIISYMKNETEIYQLLFGQFFLPLLIVIVYLQIFVVSADKYELNMYIFVIVITLLIFSVYSSINFYYNANSQKYIKLNLIGCVINIILTSLIIFCYIGYGFMIFDMNAINVSQKNLIININKKTNDLEFFATYIAYALDNLTTKIGIKISDSSRIKDIDSERMLFTLFCRAVVTTYIALVFAFISNSLFSRSGKDKN